MVQKLTGISRTTLYRWLDEAIEYDRMNERDAAWFIMVYETSPKIDMLLQKGPATRPRLAHRILDDNGATPT